MRKYTDKQYGIAAWYYPTGGNWYELSASHKPIKRCYYQQEKYMDVLKFSLWKSIFAY